MKIRYISIWCHQLSIPKYQDHVYFHLISSRFNSRISKSSIYPFDFNIFDRKCQNYQYFHLFSFIFQLKNIKISNIPIPFKHFQLKITKSTLFQFDFNIFNQKIPKSNIFLFNFIQFQLKNIKILWFHSVSIGKYENQLFLHFI